ncbi:hypothetical protein LP421_19685 [Rhizobium sp. RCAM05350]|nr:hypothetical protein LP421_19685 [Rhizobium sp. RCAM05350]
MRALSFFINAEKRQDAASDHTGQVLKAEAIQDHQSHHCRHRACFSKRDAVVDQG